MFELVHIFDLVGIGVFALSGVLIAHQKHMDGVGVLVLAAVTAIGGGTLRDLLLDVPVFWTLDSSYILVILMFSLVGVFWLNRDYPIPEKSLEILDALGLALFVIMGTNKALIAGISPEIAVVMGLITGCFGGVIRDVLANDIPLLFRQELYAACAIAGGTCFVVLNALAIEALFVYTISFSVVFVVRLVGIVYKVGIPVFRYKD